MWSHVDHVAAGIATARAQVDLEHTERGVRYGERPTALIAHYVPPFGRAAVRDAGYYVVI